MNPEPPCYHCQHYGVEYDRHTGLEDEWCDAPDEFLFYEGRRPCPHFRPILPSEGLFEQLADEEDARFYQELEEGLQEADE